MRSYHDIIFSNAISLLAAEETKADDNSCEMLAIFFLPWRAVKMARRTVYG